MEKNILTKLEQIGKEYNELQEGIEQYVVNNMSYSELKGKGSKFGIYEQKGKTMMLRLKAVGGELSTTNLKDLEEIMKEQEVPYIHLSTRQNYQLHEVKFENVKSSIEAFNKKGMYFRGGGGNTFRSILVSTYTGISKKNTFDVMPYARMVENEIFFYDKAFDFGRKLKIGFANNSEDEFVVSIQDLGFLAREINGKRGFKVYTGGGMGRGSRLGYVLLDFLPEEDLLKAVKTIIDIFHEHGDRVKRMQARLRFLVEKMGIEDFRKMFLDYFSKDNTVNAKISDIPYEEKIQLLKKFEIKSETSGFGEWKNLCVKETRFKDVVSVVLYVKNGDLTLEKLGKLNHLLMEIGAKSVRATINQNLVIPLVDTSALPFIYNYINSEIPEIVTESISNRGQLRTCVGSKICMIGIQDSMSIADSIAIELDKLADEFPEYRGVILKEAKNIRISGCGSMCAGIPIAPLGFTGMKKLIDGKLTDAMQVYIGGILNESTEALSLELPNSVIPLEELPLYVKNIFKDYLKVFMNYNMNFTTYMYEKRKNLEVSAK
ncbi:MAG: hypothetical protein ACRC6U_03700 [Fusobacteriaceae bacterium]